MFAFSLIAGQIEGNLNYKIFEHYIYVTSQLASRISLKLSVVLVSRSVTMYIEDLLFNSVTFMNTKYWFLIRLKF